mgnify:CR=1 FL=1|jgi:hypothetical protein
MKKLLILLVTFISFNLHSQYSNYYDVNVNSSINANINQNVDVDVSGNVNVNKTITSIDYGALAQANALNERNRLERTKYENDEQRRMALEIAEDPSKAFDYSESATYRYTNAQRKEFGLSSRLTMNQKILNTAIYSLNQGVWTNISNDFITTILSDFGVATTDFYNKLFGDEYEIDSNDPESHVTYNLEEGKEYLKSNEFSVWGDDAGYIHKVEVNRATVRGYNGYKGTIVYETKYEKGIVDYYHSVSNGNILSRWKVVTKGNTNEVTFEQLEGRRHYLRLLNEKQIANSSYY